MEEKEIWINGKKGLKEGFITLLTNVNRVGIKDVCNWLESTDFFTAPGSRDGHHAYPGGLVEHSLDVHFNLQELPKQYMMIPQESQVIVALLHDVCKANFYKNDTHQVKKNGQWFTEPYISIEDQFPCGHGEKSVILIQQFMSLTPHEIMAIRWHMAGFDDAARQYSGGMALTGAMQKYPLITYLHCADLLSCLPETIK